MMSERTHSVKIRQFKVGDLERVREIFSTGFDQYKTKDDAIHYDRFVQSKLEADMGDIQKHYINVKGGNFWVAEDLSLETPKIVGIVGVLPYSDEDNISDAPKNINSYELVRMSVDREYEGKGVSNSLIKTLEKFVFVELNADKIVLSTCLNMKRAVRFYEKQNYTKTHLEYYNELISIQYFEKFRIRTE